MAKKQDLVIQFIPYVEIEGLDSDSRIEKLLSIVKENKIILLEGKILPTEEAELIARTMEEIDRKFSGIEIATVQPKSHDEAFWSKMKKKIVGFLFKYQTGLTIIGPANIVKEIKKNPDNIQLLMKG